jgi:hypothetical protein
LIRDPLGFTGRLAPLRFLPFSYVFWLLVRAVQLIWRE